MKLTTKEIVVFAMLGVIMYASKLILEFAPNVHLLGVFTMAYTIVYRKKALYPIYTYVLLNGMFYGFAAWWIPYLYVWALLWGVTLLLVKKLPEQMPKKWQSLLYMSVCAVHGFLFGTLYAPVQALLFGFSFQTTLAWIAAGLPWDALHGAGNLITGLLIVPLAKLLRKLNQTTGIPNGKES